MLLSGKHQSCVVVEFYKIIPRASAVSSTNLGSILIFASCVVGPCNILCICVCGVFAEYCLSGKQPPRWSFVWQKKREWDDTHTCEVMRSFCLTIATRDRPYYSRQPGGEGGGGGTGGLEIRQRELPGDRPSRYSFLLVWGRGRGEGSAGGGQEA